MKIFRPPPKNLAIPLIFENFPGPPKEFFQNMLAPLILEEMRSFYYIVGSYKGTFTL